VPDEPIELQLQIEGDAPLSGRLRQRGRPWQRFAGWIGLAGAIDGVLAGRHPDDDRPAGDRATDEPS
jgi:hypothetical protein